MAKSKTENLLELMGITKAYPGVVANDDVSFAIEKGKIHALLGENGAGKSTLVKIIYGLVQPDKGQLLLDGREFVPSEPREARAAGVAMVFQHFSLFNALNVAENIALGMEDAPKMSELAAQISKVSQEYGLPLDPEQLVGDLSAGQRQRVEIIRCLLQNPQLLIMDEPTSVLTPQEVETLFQTLRKLRDEGRSILYISHKLEEIRQLCDSATILRLGKKVATCDPKVETARSMAELMVATSLQAPQKSDKVRGDVILTINDLNLPAQSAFGTSLKNINLSLYQGEILGICGVAGNGQDELTAVLSGEIQVDTGAINFRDKPIGHLNPTERRKLGLLAAPEERLGHSAAPNMSLTENALLSGVTRQNLADNGFIDWGKSKEFAQRIINMFDVRTPSAETAARALSGGNLQKFVVGREIIQEPEVLVVNQPTWGVDAAAAATIRQSLLDLTEKGAVVVVISQDLDELLEISDQFAALYDGQLTEPRETSSLTIDQIGLMMGGGELDVEPQARAGA